MLQPRVPLRTHTPLTSSHLISFHNRSLLGSVYLPHLCLSTDEASPLPPQSVVALHPITRRRRHCITAPAVADGAAHAHPVLHRNFRHGRRRCLALRRSTYLGQR